VFQETRRTGWYLASLNGQGETFVSKFKNLISMFSDDDVKKIIFIMKTAGNYSDEIEKMMKAVGDRKEKVPDVIPGSNVDAEDVASDVVNIPVPPVKEEKIPVLVTSLENSKEERFQAKIP
jgi:hypothetical protein